VTKREKLLAAAVLCLVAAFGAKYLYGRYDRALDLRQSQLTAAQDELATAKMDLSRGEWAVRQMEGWHQRALPANREKAVSLYKAWLFDKATAAGLAVDDIAPAPAARPGAKVSAIGFQMKASGTLSSVVALLYEFYRSPLLQQVTLLRLVRPPGATQVQVTFQSEALLLPGANATDKLPEGESKRLKFDSLAEYHKSFGDRDLVSVYTAPKPPVAAAPRERTEPPKFDDAEQAYFSGSTGIGNDKLAWINVRTTGETLKIPAGGPIKVGALEGQIVTIEPRWLVWQSGDKKYRVPLGESLRKGQELEADGTSARHMQTDRPES
jgi:hypothetical protein